MELIDTHAHLYVENFEEDRNAVVTRAGEASVAGIYLPNIDASTVDPMLALEDRHPEICHAMIGLHPCSVNVKFEEDLKQLESWFSRRTFAGIGETGTDLYWDKTFKEQQIESLVIQLGWAKAYDLPVILHSRESLDLTLEIIEKHHFTGLTGIFHCFTGTVEQARRIIGLGFYLGIGGVLTFKNSGLDATLDQIAMDHIVLETDSPYLAPVPHRGKRNEPAYIQLVAARLAEISNMDLKEIARKTTENARKVFKRK